MPGPWEKYQQPAADGPWSKYGSPSGQPKPVVEGSLSANKQPDGWFQQAQEDLQQGGNRTVIGRTLGHLQGNGDKGYTGLQSGTSKGAAEVVGSPVTGALHVAEGNVNAARAGVENTIYPFRAAHAYYEGKPAPKAPNTGTQAKEGPLKIVKGMMELGTLPGMFMAPEAGETAARAIPSAKHAGQVLNEIEHAAAGVPVNLKNSGAAISRALQLDEAGHQAPPVIKKLVARYTNPNRPDLTYSEARDFISKISKLTGEERRTASPQMKKQVAIVAKTLQQDIADAAGQVGESARYYANVKEYARAKRLAAVANAMGKTLARYGWKMAAGAGLGAGGTLGYELAKGALKPVNEPMPGGNPDLSVLPESFQKTLEGAKITQGKPTSTYGKPDIATVEEGDPNNIVVRDPSRVSAPVIAHENTHLEQSNWDPKLRAQFPKDDPNNPYLKPEDFYKFPAMRQKGMTAKDLPEEHQAQVMQAYVQYPSMRKMLQPWVDDMAKFKKSNVLPTGPEDKSINTTPRAPEAPDWAYQPIAQ